MYIPYPIAIFVIMVFMANIFVVLAFFHIEMRKRGRVLFGLYDEYHDDGVLISNWYILYIRVFSKKGWHSTMMDW